ncbi:DUF7694 domain-containing protein [Mesorhizobium qingshengii]|uniref:DUF7694 domain-containing protein n=1 Tax=Mesorhizobium qingshengii TaxID=1165689 RepID=A0A1G5V0G9_9HYPH|nr:hypothetical protein [Mesorhizobium qingshengii]SDA39369.1 hypothetical protein SAMN02927914_00139 [Mesorhizobium qingshengii]
MRNARPVLARGAATWPTEWRAAFRVYLDRELGLISVEHDGAIGWEELQAIKDRVAGETATAIEVYPPADRVVNNLPMRHLWILGADDWWPDLGPEGPPAPTTLRERYLATQIAFEGTR